MWKITMSWLQVVIRPTNECLLIQCGVYCTDGKSDDELGGVQRVAGIHPSIWNKEIKPSRRDAGTKLILEHGECMFMNTDV